jgi:hypothetical protein
MTEAERHADETTTLSKDSRHHQWLMQMVHASTLLSLLPDSDGIFHGVQQSCHTDGHIALFHVHFHLIREIALGGTVATTRALVTECAVCDGGLQVVVNRRVQRSGNVPPDFRRVCDVLQS